MQNKKSVQCNNFFLEYYHVILIFLRLLENLKIKQHWLDSPACLTLRCLWNCWTIFKKLIAWMEPNTWAMSESARTDGYSGKNKTKTTNYAQWIHVNVAMTLNCHLQASLTFAFEKTSRHKHAFSWASKLPMLGISSLQNIEGIIMWSTSTNPIWENLCEKLHANCIKTFVVCHRRGVYLSVESDLKAG